MFYLLLISPLIVLVFSFLISKYSGYKLKSKSKLIELSLIWAFIGLAVTLIMIAVGIDGLGVNAEYDAGNAPAFWMLLYCPIGIALGQVVGLLVWCNGKNI